jgi:hypothetical protein
MEYKRYSIYYNTKQDTKSLEKTHRILTPFRKKNTKIANKLPTKTYAYPGISFNIIQEQRCIRNSSIENHVEIEREQCYIKWGLHFSVDPEEESDVIGFKCALFASVLKLNLAKIIEF